MAEWYCTGCGARSSAIFPTLDPRYPLVACLVCERKRPAVADHDKALAMAKAAADAAEARKAANAAR